MNDIIDRLAALTLADDEKDFNCPAVAIETIEQLTTEVTHQRQLVQDYISALELERKRTSGIAIPHGYYLAKLDGEFIPK